MKILLNDELRDVKEGIVVGDLLIEFGYADGPFAVAVDESFVPRSEYANTVLRENARVEIVAPMQGG